MPSNTLDRECLALILALNGFPGIKTHDSCCGHGKQPFRIWFKAEDLECLPRMLYYTDGCHCGYYTWRVTVTTDCGMSPVHFCLEGPVGDEAYAQSKKIALFMMEELNAKEWRNHIDDTDYLLMRLDHNFGIHDD
jgi:hypothetical protein